MGKKDRKLKWLVLLFLALSAIILFSGPLFIINPIKTGYDKYSYGSSEKEESGSIYIDRNIQGKIALSAVYESMAELESFHNLKYKKKIDIYLCGNKKEMQRVFPFFHTNGAGFAWAGSLIIINYENAQHNGYDISTLIRHEASHSLLYQNLDRFGDKIAMSRGINRWFREGLAVYNQHFYTMSDSDFKREMERNEIAYIGKKSTFEVEPANSRTDYNLFGHFIDYLIGQYGKEKMDEYISLMILDFDDGGRNFVKIYGRDLEQELELFLLSWAGDPFSFRRTSIK